MFEASLVFHSVGGYQQMYLRPLELSRTIDGLTAVQRLLETDQQPLKPAGIAKLAGTLLKPASQVKAQATIVNGWDAPRYAFELTIAWHRITTKTRYTTLIGYTDTDKIYNDQGKIDPAVVLNINTLVDIFQASVEDDSGVHNIVSIAAPEGLIDTGGAPNKFTLRPQDVFTTLDAIKVPFDNPCPIYDMRTAVFKTPKIYDKRSACPAIWLSDTFNAYRDSVSSDILLDEDCLNRFSRACSSVQAHPLYTRHVFEILGKSTMIQESAKITYAELAAVATTLDVRVIEDRSDKVAIGVPVDGTDVATLISVGLVNSLSDALITHGLRAATFSATTGTTDHRPAVFVLSTEGLTIPDHEVTEESVLNFKHMLETVVIPASIPNHATIVAIRVCADVAGDAFIDVTLDDQPTQQYRYPLFCDNVYTSLITPSYEDVSRLSSDLKNYLDLIE